MGTYGIFLRRALRRASCAASCATLCAASCVVRCVVRCVMRCVVRHALHRASYVRRASWAASCVVLRRAASCVALFCVVAQRFLCNVALLRGIICVMLSCCVSFLCFNTAFLRCRAFFALRFLRYKAFLRCVFALCYVFATFPEPSHSFSEPQSVRICQPR